MADEANVKAVQVKLVLLGTSLSTLSTPFFSLSLYLDRHWGFTSLSCGDKRCRPIDPLFLAAWREVLTIASTLRTRSPRISPSLLDHSLSLWERPDADLYRRSGSREIFPCSSILLERFQREYIANHRSGLLDSEYVIIRLFYITGKIEGTVVLE